MTAIKSLQCPSRNSCWVLFSTLITTLSLLLFFYNLKTYSRVAELHGLLSLLKGTLKKQAFFFPKFIHNMHTPSRWNFWQKYFDLHLSSTQYNSNGIRTGRKIASCGSLTLQLHVTSRRALITQKSSSHRDISYFELHSSMNYAAFQYLFLIPKLLFKNL